MGLPLVPRPRVVEELGGVTTWRRGVVVDSPQWFEVAASFTRGVDATSDPGDGRARSSVQVRHDPALGEEEYRLTLDEEAVIEAGGLAGAAYAVTTLEQLINADARSLGPETVQVPRVRVEDAPAFAWRGVHLDVARHFFSVEDVCRFVDFAAAHKLNRLHLHLNDDQGWRVEVPAWPLLTEVGAWRASSPLGREPHVIDDGERYGGFYRADDLATIRDHAASRYVTVVPEVDLPGHAQAVLAAYPDLGNRPHHHLDVWTRWGVSEHVLAPTPEALSFAADVVGYVADLFPGSPVHVGGDECPTTEWTEHRAGRAAMRDHGFADAHRLQGLFTAAMAAAARERGREVLAWDEVLEADAPDDVVVVAWRGADRGAEAARAGHGVVMAPMDWLYLDWVSSDAGSEPPAQTAAPDSTTWEKVYAFRCVPEGLEPDAAARIRGAQAQLWTEYIATRDHLDYMAYPRLSAFAEAVWGTAGDVAEFRRRLGTHLARLGAKGLRFRPLDA
jgi:hexosaminidase